MPTIGITAAEVKRQKASLRKERERDLRKADRKRLADLRQRVKDSRTWRRERVKEIVGMCKRARTNNRERAKEIRAVARQKANQEIDALRLDAREKCQRRKLKARAKGDDAVTRAKKNLAEERGMQRSARIWAGTGRTAVGPKKKKTTAAELRAESSDEVRGNLPDELVPVFNRVQNKIKATPRMSRTEAFLEWAHNHSGTVQQIIDEEIEKDVKKLIREEQALRAQAGDPSFYKRLSDSALVQRYQAYQGAPEVPF